MISKDILNEFDKRSEQYKNKGKQGEKKIKNDNMPWF